MTPMIQSVIERQQNVLQMCEAFSAEPIVYVDHVRHSPLQSFCTMLQMPVEGYRLHMQDDLILPQFFESYLPMLEKQMEEKNTHVLSLYAPMRKRLIEQHKEILDGNRKENIVHFPNFLWMQCVVFSPVAIRGMMQMFEKSQEDGRELGGGKHDDVFVAEWLAD